jgi:4-hydroxy-2-oxoheptanedioate aldolase
MGYPNPLRQVLARGGVAFGASCQIPASALVEILGLVGYDFVMIDTEHGLFDMQSAGELIRTAHGANLTPLVRVQKNEPVMIMKALDLGAQGVIIPHISNKGDAIQAVAASKYSGKRGACPLVRAAGYGTWKWQTYQENADRDTLVILLIEDMEGVQNIEDILSVDGIDVIFLGAFDMSVSSGHQGDVRHPDVQNALDHILAACKDHNIPLMHSLTGGADAEAWVKKGVRLVMQSADTVVFARAHQAYLESVAHLRVIK